jgi:hypothetical protein
MSGARGASKEVGRWALYGLCLYLGAMAAFVAILVAAVVMLQLSGFG